MNRERRNKITSIMQKLDKIKDELQDVLSDEEFAFDNMPENLQGSIRGEESEEAISSMEEAIENIEEAQSILENI